MAFTTVPSSGAKLRASVLSALVTELRPVTKIQAADSSAVVSSTVLVNVTGFSVSVAASATYDLYAVFRYNSATAADWKFGWTFPAGLTMFYVADGIVPAASAFTYQDLIQTSVPTFEGAGVGNVRDVVLHGTVTTVSAGTLQLQHAQVTSDASNTVFRASSRLALYRTG